MIPTPDDRLDELRLYILEGRRALSPSHDRLLAFYDKMVVVMSEMLLRLRRSRVNTPERAIEFFDSIDPDLLASPVASADLVASTTSWNTPEFQRAFLQYVVGSYATQSGQLTPDSELPVLMPFLARESDWELTDSAFEPDASDSEAFLPGLLWKSILAGDELFPSRLLQDTGMTTDELRRHLRPSHPGHGREELE